MAELAQLEGRLSELEAEIGGSGLGVQEAARLAELKRRQAAGELTPEEEAELRRLEAKAAQAAGGGRGGRR